MNFIEEMHGDGPVHFSASFKEVVFEIYPEMGLKRDRVVFMVEVSDIVLCVRELHLYGGKVLEPVEERNGVKRVLVEDPDGRMLRVIGKVGLGGT